MPISLRGRTESALEAARRDCIARADLLTDDAETQLNLGKAYFLDRRLRQKLEASR